MNINNDPSRSRRSRDRGGERDQTARNPFSLWPPGSCLDIVEENWTIQQEVLQPLTSWMLSRDRRGERDQTAWSPPGVALLDLVSKSSRRAEPYGEKSFSLCPPGSYLEIVEENGTRLLEVLFALLDFVSILSRRRGPALSSAGGSRWKPARTHSLGGKARRNPEH